MGVVKKKSRLTPELVKLAIQEEVSLREKLPPQFVQDVLRYGVVVGSRIENYHKAARCMDLARQHIVTCEDNDVSFASGTVFIADKLTGSKGRFLRDWHAPDGGLWLVLALANTLLPENAALIPVAAGVACCETVRHFGIDASVKWVNDVVVDGRKIAGILSETMRANKYDEEYVLVGIGLNVNNCAFPAELQGQAISMAQSSQMEYVVEDVAARLLAKLAWNIGLLHYVENEHLSAGLPVNEQHPLLDSWLELTDSIGRRVRYGYNAVSKPLFTARTVGIDSAGGLIMKLADGTFVTEHSGEIIYLDSTAQ